MALIRLRSQQMHAFSEDALERYVKRLCRLLAREFPDELRQHGVGPADLEAFVRRGIDDAEQYGVVGQKDVELYVKCRLLLSPQFDRDPRYPWAARILSDPALAGTTKMDRIHDQVVFGGRRAPT